VKYIIYIDLNCLSKLLHFKLSNNTTADHPGLAFASIKGSFLHLASKELEKPEATAAFSVEQLEEINQMMESEVTPRVLIDVIGMKRLSMHTTLLERYQDTVKSTTCTIDGTSTMKIEKSTTPAVNKKPLESKRFLYFSLIRSFAFNRPHKGVFTAPVLFSMLLKEILKKKI